MRNKHTLPEWLAANAMSVETFAASIPTSRVTVWRWCSGESFPRRRALARIASLTDGQVTADSFAGIPARGDAA